jgi:transposase InsO family protein
MIDDIHQATGHGIRRICATLGVSRSSYYHAAAPTPMQSSDEAIGLEIEVVFKRHRRRYGYRRIRDELADQGITCAPARVRRIMLERGLKAIQPKTYVPRTSDGRADKPSPNLLLDQPLPELPNRVWAGDITFIPTSAGWIYLAVVIDLCSRKIVGWALADHLRTELVSDALKQALGSRDTVPDLIFHSDRGSQYGSGSYRQILSHAGMRQSMSARANPYHNAWTESFMGTLKSEMLQDGCFIDATDARTEIFDYIESYYNHHRKHSALGYQTPAQFEAKIHSPN